MKKLCYKLFLSLFICAFVLLLTSSTLNKFWGNHYLRSKISCYSKLSTDFSTVFLGSSRINHHVQPIIFDSLTNSNSRSFNLGIGAGSYYENFAALKYLVEHRNIDRVFVEYYTYFGGNHPGATTVQRSYFWDLNLLSSAIKKYKNDFNQLLWHIEFSIRRFFLLGHGRDILVYKLHSFKEEGFGLLSKTNFLKKNRLNKIFKKVSSKETITCENNGYSPLTRRNFNKAKLNKFDEWHKKFELGNNRKYNNTSVTLNQNTENFYLELQEYLEGKDIQLFIIFEPNQFQYYKSSLRKKIYLGDGVDFPEYFEKHYWWDLGLHLNHDGASVYTKQLAKAVNDFNFGANEIEN